MKLPWIRIAIISGALVVGYATYHITGEKDHHIEQIVEQVLRHHGIDIDFSGEE